MFLLVAFVVPSHTQERPLFTAGQTYTVAWDCVPLFLANMASQALNASVDPCYLETLTVQAVRKDGWLQVTDTQTGDGWVVNANRMMGVKPAAVARVAGR